MTKKKWERLEPTFSLEDERLASLKQIVPEAFTDGKVDFDALKELLGEVVEDESAEHFGLNWTGKREARRLAGMPSKGTLVPVPGKGLHEDTTENIFIEGDNLEVLKLLHRSYRGKIKMIYIDPPYNTGNDFIYKDDYRMPLESYLQRSGQKSDMGELLTSNPKSSGRFHSDWLNMMYPRLRVAKDLLREDGVIFVSIDDNEVHNLRQVMNEIFGEENFVEQIVWKKRYQGAKEKHLVSVHEYILFYALNKDTLDPIYVPSSQDQIDKYYKYRDENFEKRGPFRTQPLEAGKSMGDRVNLVSSIPAPDGSMVLPKRQWIWSEERISAALEKGEIGFTKDNQGNWSVFIKQYLKDEAGAVRETKLFSIIDNVFTQNGTAEITQIFGDGNVFPFPKPTKLLCTLLSIGTTGEGDEIVLDFFSGSGSMPHAVLIQNASDLGKRRFVAVQLGEPTPQDSAAAKAGFGHISDITIARIKRVSDELSIKGGLQLSDGLTQGVRCLRLDCSNFKAWSDYEGNDLDELRGLLQSQLDSTFVDEATEDAILTEIVLLEGFPLTSKIELDPTFQKNAVRRISHEWCEHKLFVTLDKEIQEETIRTIDQMIDSDEMSKLDIFICLDNALTDQDKLRLADVCRLKTI